MLQDTAMSLCKNPGEGDTQAPSQSDTAGKAQAQNMEALQKNRVRPLYKCSECYYASILEQNLYDHVASNHMKVDHEGQSRFTSGTNEAKANRIEENNVANANAFQYHEYLPTPVVKEKTKNTSKTTGGYKCEMCDFVTNRKYDLKGHINTIHKGSQEGSMFKCNLCEYSTLHNHLMGQHISEFHPSLQQDKPSTTKRVDGLDNNKKKSPNQTKKSAAKEDSRPKEKSRDLRDKHNAFERGRRLDQAKLFKELKDLVPKLRDIVKTVAKKQILDGAAEYSQVLGEQDLVLSREQEELAKRNAELRQRLAAARRKFEEASTVWGQMMRDIRTEGTSDSIYGLNQDVLDEELLGVLE